MTVKKKRIWELDFWRGLAIILVVFDHAFFDFGRLFYQWKDCGVTALEWLNSIGVAYLESDVRAFWRPAFLFLFFCVSGLCTALSKNNFFRGVKLWTVAACLSALTFLADVLFDADVFILFGVLHCLAVVIILYSAFEFLIKGAFFLAEKIIKKPIKENWKAVIFFIATIALSVAFYLINRKFNPLLIDVETHGTVSELDGKLFGMFFYSKEWWTGDYFPVFPYISFFFFGAAISKLIYREKKSLFPFLDGIWHAPFTVAGKHSLAVYLIGQVAAIGLGIILTLAFLGSSSLFF